MNSSNRYTWDGVERRQSNSCRRSGERRSFTERRHDIRMDGRKPKRSFYGWVRSLTRNRLGVDRRKITEERRMVNRRNPRPSTMLTKDELADLLK